MGRRTRVGRFRLRGRSGERGLTYLGFLIALAVISAVLAATAEVWVTAQRREKERELLFVGNQFRQALARYYNNTPGSAGKSYPKRLEELLQDNRYLETKRYLRRIYVDPMTGKNEWGLTRLPDDQIIGVHSLSEQEPLKKAGFRPADTVLENKAKYSEWVFMHAGQTAPQAAPQEAPGTFGRGRTR